MMIYRVMRWPGQEAQAATSSVPTVAMYDSGGQVGARFTMRGIKHKYGLYRQYPLATRL